MNMLQLIQYTFTHVHFVQYMETEHDGHFIKI